MIGLEVRNICPVFHTELRPYNALLDEALRYLTDFYDHEGPFP